jgi:hypothetical protein
MPSPVPTAASLRLRNLYFMQNPQLWEVWPFLPLMRRRPGVEEEWGVLYDARTCSGKLGFSATVFLQNLFLLPSTEAEILQLPRETFDTVEEVFDAGWTIE